MDMGTHRNAYSHSHEGYTTLAPKPAAGGANGTENIGIISESASGWTRPGRDGRRVRVVLPDRWKTVERVKTEMQVVVRKREIALRVRYLLLEGR